MYAINFYYDWLLLYYNGIIFSLYIIEYNPYAFIELDVLFGMPILKYILTGEV